MGKPKILLTNDDGVNAPGLRKLIEIMRPLGDVYVVASDRIMSGTGHAITVRTPLRVHELKKEKGYEEYVCDGTPVDCAKLGIEVVIGEKPDLLVSGINHGSNASINVIYSGTMAAVLEGCIDGIPSVGFSLLDYSFKADFSHCDPFVTEIAKNVLEHGLSAGTCLNVNIPAVNGEEINGIKVCRQARARWIGKYDARTDPSSRDYYWLTGHFENQDNGDDTDQHALENNFVSVVPVHTDLTAYHAISELNNWKLNG
ncbi:MAG: 5'/3'-nucleotidase SurE [Bacteroidota bacterium]|nr:5'/3'-nucleotidase SurE [Bacteroidota bacterium]